MTTTARTKRLLESLGYAVALVERYNHYTRRRMDAFGIADQVAIRENWSKWFMNGSVADGAKPRSILFVQSCAASGLAAHRKKLLAAPMIHDVIRVGIGVWIVAWAKRGPRGKRKVWVPTIEEVEP